MHHGQAVRSLRDRLSDRFGVLSGRLFTRITDVRPLPLTLRTPGNSERLAPSSIAAQAISAPILPLTPPPSHRLVPPLQSFLFDPRGPVAGLGICRSASHLFGPPAVAGRGVVMRRHESISPVGTRGLWLLGAVGAVRRIAHRRALGSHFCGALSFRRRGRRYTRKVPAVQPRITPGVEVSEGSGMSDDRTFLFQPTTGHFYCGTTGSPDRPC